MPDPPIEPSSSEHRAGSSRSLDAALESVSDEVRLRGQRVLLELNAMHLTDPEILEVGCGTGWFTEKLSHIGTTTGVDLSPDAIAMARANHPQIDFVCADFCRAGYSKHAFDVVVCLETLFHVEDPPRFVSELSRVLRPGGILLLTTLNKFVYERRSDIGPPAPDDERNWLTKKDLRVLLRAHFDLEKEITLDPRGDRGLFRVVNSRRLNSMLGRVVGPPRLRAMKERAGWGGGVVYVARNP